MDHSKSDCYSPGTDLYIYTEQEICASSSPELKKYLSVGKLIVAKKGKRVRKREQ